MLARHSLSSLLAVRPLERVYAGSRLGAGTGEVLVHQLLPGLPVAECEETAALFEQHMTRLAAMTDPGTLPVTEFVGGASGPFYYVTDVPIGVTLGELLRATGSLPAPAAAALGIEIAERLAHAHGHGVHHFALNRTQVLVAPDLRVTVLDLGLVPLLLDRVHGRLRRVSIAWEGLFPEAGAVAPETLAEEATGPATDVYGLGVLLYLMATATLPYTGSSIVAYNAILGGRTTIDPRSEIADLDPSFADLVSRCLRRDPAERPQDMATVIAALRTIAAPLGDALAPYLGVVHARSYIERFTPLLRVVDGGRGQGGVAATAPSVAVTSLFRDKSHVGEAELLARMTPEQRRLYLDASHRNEPSEAAFYLKRDQAKRGIVLGAVLAAVVLLFFLPALLRNPSAGSRGESSVPVTWTDDPERRSAENVPARQVRRSIVLYR